MFVHTEPKYWILLNWNSTASLVRREDLARVEIPRELRAALKEELASQSFTVESSPTLSPFLDGFVAFDPKGFLPVELFFNQWGTGLARDDFAAPGIAMLPSDGFFVAFARVRHPVLGETFARLTNLGTDLIEARRLAAILAERYDMPLIDPATRYHSAWVSVVSAGATMNSYEQWLSNTMGLAPDLIEQGLADSIVYEGYMIWDTESRCPFYAPQGLADPVLDCDLYPTKAEATFEKESIEPGYGAEVVFVKIHRNGQIDEFDVDGQHHFSSVSRERFYGQFGVELPGSVVSQTSLELEP